MTDEPKPITDEDLRLWAEDVEDFEPLQLHEIIRTLVAELRRMRAPGLWELKRTYFLALRQASPGVPLDKSLVYSVKVLFTPDAAGVQLSEEVLRLDHERIWPKKTDDRTAGAGEEQAAVTALAAAMKRWNVKPNQLGPKFRELMAFTPDEVPAVEIPPAPPTDEELDQITTRYDQRDSYTADVRTTDTWNLVARLVAEVRRLRAECAGYENARRINFEIATVITDTDPEVARRVLADLHRTLRLECDRVGMNDWAADLHPADVVAKHLVRGWEAAFDRGERP